MMAAASIEMSTPIVIRDSLLVTVVMLLAGGGHCRMAITGLMPPLGITRQRRR
jgi:hypothetical protein